MVDEYPIDFKSLYSSRSAQSRSRRTLTPWDNYLGAWGTAAQKQPLPIQSVLVVDDADLVLRSTCRILKKRFLVDTAKSAEQAIVKLKNSNYFSVISDYLMTGKDGIWLLSWVQNLQPQAIRVLVSSTQPKGLESVLTTGLLHGFVKKPLKRHDLFSTLFENATVTAHH